MGLVVIRESLYHAGKTAFQYEDIRGQFTLEVLAARGVPPRKASARWSVGYRQPGAIKRAGCASAGEIAQPHRSSLDRKAFQQDRSPVNGCQALALFLAAPVIHAHIQFYLEPVSLPPVTPEREVDPRLYPLHGLPVQAQPRPPRPVGDAQA